MLTDESVLDWAKGWLRDNTQEDPTFRQRFLDGLAEELRERRSPLTKKHLNTLDTVLGNVEAGFGDGGELDDLQDEIEEAADVVRKMRQKAVG